MDLMSGKSNQLQDVLIQPEDGATFSQPMAAQPHYPGGPVAPSGGQMPQSYTMAAPLDDNELTALLMASPLYNKLEQMKKAVSSGGLRTGHKMASGNATQLFQLIKTNNDI